MYPLPTLDFLPIFSLAHLANIFLLFFPFLAPAIPLNFLERLRPHSA